MLRVGVPPRLSRLVFYVFYANLGTGWCLHEVQVDWADAMADDLFDGLSGEDFKEAIPADPMPSFIPAQGD